MFVFVKKENTSEKIWEGRAEIFFYHKQYNVFAPLMRSYVWTSNLQTSRIDIGDDIIKFSLSGLLTEQGESSRSDIINVPINIGISIRSWACHVDQIRYDPIYNIVVVSMETPAGTVNCIHKESST